MVHGIRIRDHGLYSTFQAKLLGGHLFADVLPEASSVLKSPTLGKGVFKPATLLPSSQGIKSEYSTLGSSTFSISCKFINESVFFKISLDKLLSASFLHPGPLRIVYLHFLSGTEKACSWTTPVQNTGSCKMTLRNKGIPHRGSLNMNPTGRAWIVGSLHSRYASEH